MLVQAPLFFGGGAEEGSMFIRIQVAYANINQGTAAVELVGLTDIIKVGWKRAPFEYLMLRGVQGPRLGGVLGGVYVKYHLLTEAETASPEKLHDVQASCESPKKRLAPFPVPAEALHRVSARTGNFPPGSAEEAYEQAAMNAEAQNRALLQRCKIADPKSHTTEPHTKLSQGYRQWENLDMLFATMGPNPLAMCPELGPVVARSYQDRCSIMQDLAGKLPTPMGPADEELNLKLIRSVCPEDPQAVRAALRPTMCKDPDTIAQIGNLAWCPEVPVYAPMSSMHEEDKETLRLACYAPETNAKLLFVDANPNYHIDEDIWGACADYKLDQAPPVIGKPPGRRRRVKDDCIMA